MRAILKRCWTSKVSGGELPGDNNRHYGIALGLPRSGEIFQLAGPVDGEAVTTTEVLHTRELAPRLHRFYTKNSVYELELLPDLGGSHAS